MTTNNQDTITIYIRKVDRKGMKITLPINQPITQNGFYHFLIEKPQFIRFIDDQLKKVISLNIIQLTKQQIKSVIQLYFQGNLMDKQQGINNRVIKFRNLSIVHVIVVKKKMVVIGQSQHKQDTIKEEFKQQQQQQQQQQTQNKNHLFSQKIHTHRQIQIQADKIQPPPKKQQQIITLNIKILLNSKTCTIINQHQQKISRHFVNNNDLMAINGSRVLKLTQDELKQKSIYECLIGMKIGEMIKGRLLNKQGKLCFKQQQQQQTNDNNNKAQQQRVYQLVGYKVKVIHLGKAVQVVFAVNNEKDSNINNQRQQQQQSSIYKKTVNNNNNTKWSQLNIVSNSQIIVMVTKIELKQQTINNVIIQEKLKQSQSLYLQLQHVLTLRLYQQYSSNYSVRQWKWGHKHYLQQQQQQPKIKDAINNFNKNKQITLLKSQHNKQLFLKSRQNNSSTGVLKLSYQFDPFKQQQSLFYYRNMNKNNINKVQQPQQHEQQQSTQQLFKQHISFIDDNNKLQQQSQLSQQIDSQLMSKQTDADEMNIQRQNDNLVKKQQQQKKTQSILIY